jgi:hypothetical protein
MPIIFERAFGGVSSNGQSEPTNPVGLGFRGASPVDQTVNTVAPNVEYAGSGARRPAGFGVIGRGWRPRVEYAGTYDDRWLRSRWPLLPTDFDVRHYQAAPEDQQSRSIHGGEDVHVVNMTPEGTWRFRLPVLDVPMHLLYEGRIATTPLRMDTVVLEPDRYSLTLTMRTAIRTVRSAPLREIVLGHVTRAWIRARDSRRFYINHGGGDGTDLQRACFHP